MKRLIFITLAVVFAVTLTFNYSFAGVEKVTLCHQPGTPAQKTLKVPPSAVEAHLNHGDYLGECSSDCPPCPGCDSCCLEPEVWIQSPSAFGTDAWSPLQFLSPPIAQFFELNVYYGTPPYEFPYIPPYWYTITCDPPNDITRLSLDTDPYFIELDISGCTVLSKDDPNFLFALVFGAGSVMRIFEDGTISLYTFPD